MDVGNRSTGVRRTKFRGSRTGYIICWAQDRIQILVPLSEVMKNFKTGSRGYLTRPRALCDHMGCKPTKPPWGEWPKPKGRVGHRSSASLLSRGPPRPQGRGGGPARRFVGGRYARPHEVVWTPVFRFMFFSPLRSSLGCH